MRRAISAEPGICTYLDKPTGGNPMGETEPTILYEPWTINVDEKGTVAVTPKISGARVCSWRYVNGRLCFCCDTPGGEVCYVCANMAIKFEG